MSKGSPPTPPDPATTIAAQSAANTQSATQNAALNRVNQVTPYGNLTYSQNGTDPSGVPNYTATVDLSPAEQAIFNNYTQGQTNLGNIALGMQGQVANSYANPIDTSGQPGINSTGGSTAGIQQLNASGIPGQLYGFGGYGNVQGSLDLSGLNPLQSSVQNQSNAPITGQIQNGANSPWAIPQAEYAAYQQQAQFLNPQFAQKHEALDNSLINQGITMGSDAWKTGQQNLGLQENQAYGNAGLQAVMAGQQEQNTLFGQGLSAAQLQNAANAQGYSQGLSSAELANSTNQQGYNQALGAGQFANQAQAQQYGQAANNADFYNQAQQSSLNQLIAQQQANNSAQQQQYGQQFGNAQLQNNANAQYLQQLFALRNQPLNEYNSLMTGAQVQSPQFQQVPTANVATTDVGGITNSSYQNQLAAYNAKQQGMNNLFGLGGQLGAAAILA